MTHAHSAGQDPANDRSGGQKARAAEGGETRERKGGKRRRRRRKRRPVARSRPTEAAKAGGKSSLDERAARVYDELCALLGEVLVRQRIPRHLASEVTLSLETSLRAASQGVSSNGAAGEFARHLLESLKDAAEDAAAARQPFPPGRIHCYWCDSFECSHATPPESRAVFRGYSPTGVPQWSEFGSVALEQGHPQIHDLYEGDGLPITLLQGGSEVREQQLPVYGKESGTYRILAQLAVGYLTTASRRREEPTLALTLQIVETQRRRSRFDLNVIGVLPDGRTVGRFVEEVVGHRLADALHAARRSLADLALLGGRRRRGQEGAGERSKPDPPQGPPGDDEKEQLAVRILERLARNVDRIYRQNSRRTLHARDRRRDRERPTANAVKDALEARAESIYRDVEEHTWVVIGPRRRVHVFNDHGRHVTSLTYPGETIRKRTRKGKWRGGDPQDLERFRQAVRASLREGRSEGGEAEAG